MAKRTVSVEEAREQLGKLLDSVSRRGGAVIIERDGETLGVLISADRYAIMEQSRERLFKMIDEVHERNRDVPPEVIQAEVDEAIRAVRAAARAK